MRPISSSASQTPDPERPTFSIAGHLLNAPRPAPGLHLVATPIGNLSDITLRALETLAGADVIACEDSRVTRKLLDRFLIATRLTPYHEHNAAQARPKLLERLAQGAAIALVSDAGTPLISDPGFKLVREAAMAGHTVIAVPGASSVLAGLSVAGLPTDRFYFEGFLPSKEGARRNRIGELARIDATLVLFESGNRIGACLRDLALTLGNRDASVCREMTKLHEEIRRAPLETLAADADQLETRGEFVVVVAPPDVQEGAMTDAELDDILGDALTTSSVKDAVAQAVELSGRAKRDVYARALQLSKATRNQDNGQDDHDDET
jgi:16S rRNA (cytidine1402-2'-O)-methyltransferase